MQAYLDSNVVSAIVKDDTASESDAIDRLLEAHEKGQVHLCAKHGCTIFLTCDGGVLSRVSDIRRLCGVVAQKPSELVAALANG